MPPWYDETFFASISHSYAATGKFMVSIQPLVGPKGEFLYYGPVYFVLQSVLIKAGFFTIFTFRLLNFAGFWASIFLLYKLAIFLGVEKKKGRWFIVILATNFFMVTNASSGRMDMLSFCFFAAALYYWRAFLIKQVPRFIQMIIGSVFITLAFLTTPRISFLFLLPAICITQRLIKAIINKEWQRVFQIIAIPLMIFSLIYMSWIKPKFGSFYAYLEVFTQNSDKIIKVSFLNNFLYTHVLYLLLGAYYLYHSYKLIPGNKRTFIIAVFVTAVVFISVVAPLSFYHCIIIPLLLMLMCIAWQSTTFSSSSKHTLWFWFKTVIVLQVIFLATKYTIIWTDKAARNASVLQTEVAKRIPPGSRVIGNFNYFYAVIANGSAFQCIENLQPNAQPTPIKIEDKINHQLANFDFDYLIVNATGNIPAEYISSTELVNSISIPLTGESLLKKIKSTLKMPYKHYYDAHIYKRKRIGTQ